MKKKSLKQKIVAHVFSIIPLSLLGKLTRTSLIISYYHMVSDEEVLHTKYLYAHKNIQQFKNDIDFILRNYNPISLFDLLDYLKKERTLPDKAFLLTFDDGFREMHDVVAPILLKKGVPATFFINSEFSDNNDLCYQHKASILVEHFQKLLPLNTIKEIKKIFQKNNLEFKDIKSDILSIKYHQKDVIDEIAHLMNIDFNDYLSKYKPYLTSNQVKGLINDGFAIGGHSIDHPFYALLSHEDQLYQTIESIKFIKDKFGLDYAAFAFPHGDQGVSKEFFTELHKSGLVDVFFGTGGMMDNTSLNNFQRISFENPLMPAEKIIPLHHAKKLLNLPLAKRNLLEANKKFRFSNKTPISGYDSRIIRDKDT